MGGTGRRSRGREKPGQFFSSLLALRMSLAAILLCFHLPLENSSLCGPSSCWVAPTTPTSSSLWFSSPAGNSWIVSLCLQPFQPWQWIHAQWIIGPWVLPSRLDPEWCAIQGAAGLYRTDLKFRGTQTPGRFTPSLNGSLAWPPSIACTRHVLKWKEHWTEN